MTLVIIGVIASMTIPGLKRNTDQKQLEASFKKAYSAVNQGLSRMEVDYMSVKPSSFMNRTFEPVYKNYFNLLKDCGLEGCTSRGTSDYNIKNYKTFSKSGNVSTTFFDDGQFITADGMMFMIENPTGQSVSAVRPLLITVDTNGIEKQPNAWGHDLFSFQLMPDGSLLPVGAENTAYTDKNTYCSPASANGLNGIACAYYAMADKDYWKNLP